MGKVVAPGFPCPHSLHTEFRPSSFTWSSGSRPPGATLNLHLQFPVRGASACSPLLLCLAQRVLGLPHPICPLSQHPLTAAVLPAFCL